jgi:hypothetical protein
MATVVWKGAVAAVAQVTDWTFGGTWETSDVITVTIGSKSVSTTAGSATIATVITNLVTTLSEVNEPEFYSIEWSAYSSTVLRATAAVAGVPFTVTIATTETGGGAADAQTINGTTSSTGTATVACTGPNFANVAGNWVGGALPVDGDTVVFANSDVSVLYGLDLNAVTPAAIYFDSSYTGEVGLSAYNSSNGGIGYFEYRERYLKFCNSGDASTTEVYIGQGSGTGSGRIQLDCGTGRANVYVYKTGPSPESGQGAFRFRGTHASNTITVQRGTVYIGADGGSNPVVATLKVGYVSNEAADSVVDSDTGVTLTTVEVSGGTLTTRSAMTTLTMTGGVMNHYAGAVTTATVEQGTLNYLSTGTITNLKVGGGAVFDCRGSMSARTITNLELHSGSEFHDPAGTVTATNGYDFYRCSIGETVFNVVPHRTWTPTSI